MHHERFEDLSNEVKITQACESAGFMRKVTIGQYFKTTHDVEDLEVRPEPAESIHYLVIIQIPNLLHESVDTPGSVQFFKSKSHVVLINTWRHHPSRFSAS